MRIARRVGLFVFMGGPIGGLVTIAVVTIWALAQPSSEIDLSLVPGLFVYLIVGALVGLFVGIPPSLITGISHALFPRVRNWGPIALVGGVTSAVEGFFLPHVLYVSGRADLEASMTFAAVFALAGGVAAISCHAQAQRSLD